MPPTPPSEKTADWNSDDAANLRNFLGTQTGERLMVHLGECVPELLGGGDVNSILIRSGEVKGGSSILVNLVSLTHKIPSTVVPVVKDNHPDLDDDDAFDPQTNLPK